MKLYRAAIYLLSAGCVASIAFWRTLPVQGSAQPPTAPVAATWSESAAAKYLDDRELWWQSWPKAQKDHGTICISCHTTVPYAMARPALRRALHESLSPRAEVVMIHSVENRVYYWSKMVPFYSDGNDGPGKTAESHSTEAVMNAVILTIYDRNMQDKDGWRMPPITRKAFDEVWALQLQTGEDAGGWIWQDFHLAPWESHESGYQGAATLMLVLGLDPQIFMKTPEDSGMWSCLKIICGSTMPSSRC